mmetsp:Transcript_142/g.244  ORF Transcript_142/g.244 Transcript_142/m.244 type:complete len:272 (+) Transcript_142:37-852(+)
MNHMYIPFDIWTIVCDYLNPQELCRLSRTNKKLWTYMEEEGYEKHIKQLITYYEKHPYTRRTIYNKQMESSELNMIYEMTKERYQTTHTSFYKRACQLRHFVLCYLANHFYQHVAEGDDTDVFVYQFSEPIDLFGVRIKSMHAWDVGQRELYGKCHLDITNHMCDPLAPIVLTLDFSGCFRWKSIKYAPVNLPRYNQVYVDDKPHLCQLGFAGSLPGCTLVVDTKTKHVIVKNMENTVWLEGIEDNALHELAKGVLLYSFHAPTIIKKQIR